MYLDTGVLPPAPGGPDPEPPPPAKITPGEERLLIGLVLLAIFAITIAPFAGSSVVSMVIALF